MRKNLGCKKSPADEEVFGIICGRKRGEHANHIQISRQQRGAVRVSGDVGVCPRSRSVCRRRAQPQKPCKKVVSRGLSPCVPDRITSTVSQGSDPLDPPIIIITIPMQEQKFLRMIQNIIQLLYGSGLEDIYDKEMLFGICIGSLWV